MNKRTLAYPYEATNTLQDTILAMSNAFPGHAGVYARHLVTGEMVMFMPDSSFRTFTAGKVFILLAYAHAVAMGQLDPAQRLKLQPADFLPGTGALRYCAPGLSVALDDLAALMIAHSDNIATNLLLRALGGPDAVNSRLAQHGLDDARCISPLYQGDFCVSTPRALAETYALLAPAHVPPLGERATDLARQILAHHQDVEGMSRYLPWSPYAADFHIDLPAQVFSKSGQFPGSQTEAGLYVTAGGSYVAAAMLTDIDDPRNNSAAPGAQFLADFGAALYAAWGNPD